MLDRGYTMALEPERFPKHAKLAASLKRLPGWEELDDKDAPKAHQEPEPKKQDAPGKQHLLPHQQAAIEKIKSLNSTGADP